jgi:hypothetical protein
MLPPPRGQQNWQWPCLTDILGIRLRVTGRVFPNRKLRVCPTPGYIAHETIVPATPRKPRNTLRLEDYPRTLSKLRSHSSRSAYQEAGAARRLGKLGRKTGSQDPDSDQGRDLASGLLPSHHEKADCWPSRTSYRSIDQIPLQTLPPLSIRCNGPCHLQKFLASHSATCLAARQRMGGFWILHQCRIDYTPSSSIFVQSAH